MKNTLRSLSFLLLVILTAGVAVSAQSPDPTGRGRYVVVGPVSSQAGAVMVTQLPAGASCGPVGELLGQRVRNSTGNGVANTVELTSNAEIAVAPNGDVYLCKCGMSGRYFNRLFPQEEAQKSDVFTGGQQQQQQFMQPVVNVAPPVVHVAAPAVAVNPTINVPETKVVVINKCDNWCKANTFINGADAVANIFQAVGTFKVAKAINNIKLASTSAINPGPVVYTDPPTGGLPIVTSGSGGFNWGSSTASVPYVASSGFNGGNFVWR